MLKSLPFQCDQVATELTAVLLQRRNTLKSCLDILHSYATVVSHFPQSFVQRSRNGKWQEWLQEIVCDFSSTKWVPQNYVASASLL